MMTDEESLKYLVAEQGEEFDNLHSTVYEMVSTLSKLEYNDEKIEEAKKGYEEDSTQENKLDKLGSKFKGIFSSVEEESEGVSDLYNSLSEKSSLTKDSVAEKASSLVEGYTLAFEMYEELEKLVREVNKEENEFLTNIGKDLNSLMNHYAFAADLINGSIYENGAIGTSPEDLDYDEEIAEEAAPFFIRKKIEKVIEEVDDSDLVKKLTSIKERSYGDVDYPEIEEMEDGIEEKIKEEGKRGPSMYV